MYYRCEILPKLTEFLKFHLFIDAVFRERKRNHGSYDGFQYYTKNIIQNAHVHIPVTQDNNAQVYNEYICAHHPENTHTPE